MERISRRRTCHALTHCPVVAVVLVAYFTSVLLVLMYRTTRGFFIISRTSLSLFVWRAPVSLHEPRFSRGVGRQVHDAHVLSPTGGSLVCCEVQIASSCLLSALFIPWRFHSTLTSTSYSTRSAAHAPHLPLSTRRQGRKEGTFQNQI